MHSNTKMKKVMLGEGEGVHAWKHKKKKSYARGRGSVTEKTI